MSAIELKNIKFNKVLQSAKHALDSCGVRFHLHAGTALGALRERHFIPHDHDIDLAVFYKDVNSKAKADKLQRAMEEEGFELDATLGTIKGGYELQFQKDGVDLDIFWIYEGEYRGKKYFILSSYYGRCDSLPKQKCIWAYRPYKVKRVRFLGANYDVVPQYTLVDMYGKDWRIPKKYGYHEGIEQGHYKSFIRDYFKPRSEDKIAFCFLLYSKIDHQRQWEKFFSQDDYPVKSYSIYSHVKKVTDETPKWILDGKIRTRKTEWCEESLVWAWMDLLKNALRDPKNKYFCILSGSCIPILSYEKTYKKIFSSHKSRINIQDEDLAAKNGLYYAGQWCILNRKHAELLLKLRDTEAGHKYRLKLKNMLCNDEVQECNCPDEIYPINWFIHKYGKPSGAKFREEFIVKATTYTYWDGIKPHPMIFNGPMAKKFKGKICKSGAIFARKFNNKAAGEIAMIC